MVADAPGALSCGRPAEDAHGFRVSLLAGVVVGVDSVEGPQQEAVGEQVSRTQRLRVEGQRQG